MSRNVFVGYSGKHLNLDIDLLPMSVLEIYWYTLKLKNKKGENKKIKKICGKSWNWVDLTDLRDRCHRFFFSLESMATGALCALQFLRN